VKKKYTASQKDKKDWLDFTKQIGDINPKEEDIYKKEVNVNRTLKLDLHGFSLDEANEKTKNFIIDSFNHGYKKLLIVTGKGSRSKSYNDPYISEKLSILKYSVPEFINNNVNLISKISKISKADVKDGGEGAVYIILKNKKKLNFKE